MSAGAGVRVRDVFPVLRGRTQWPGVLVERVEVDLVLLGQFLEQGLVLAAQQVDRCGLAVGVRRRVAAERRLVGSTSLTDAC